MVLRAKEIMSDRIISVRPDTPIEQATARLTEHRFSALPVVDEHNRLVGMVSAADVLRTDRERNQAVRPHTVGGVMSRSVVCMSPEADIGVLAHRLRRYGALRVMPIVEHGFLVGVITQADLLRPRPRGGKLGRLARRFLDHLRMADSSQTPASIALPARAPTARPGKATPSAQEVMTPADRVVTVTENTSTTRAAHLMTRHRLAALPVVDDAGLLVGLVSEADLVHDPLDARRIPSPTTVAEAMSTELDTCRPDSDVGELARILTEGGRRVIPIVDNGGRLLGVVSRGDLLRLDSVRHPSWP